MSKEEDMWMCVNEVPFGKKVYLAEVKIQAVIAML